MSRIGSKPIKIISGIKVSIKTDSIEIIFADRSAHINIPRGIQIENKGESLWVSQAIKNNKTKALLGLISRLITGAMEDLSHGVKKELEIVGTGYRAKIEGEKLILSIGYSHTVEVIIPKNIKIEIKKNLISINGYNRQVVGELVANIRKVRPPEVYKGKGIRYRDEIIKKKAGKAAQTAGT